MQDNFWKICMITFIEAPILADQLKRACKAFNDEDPRFNFITRLQERLTDKNYNRKFSYQESMALDNIFMQAGLYASKPPVRGCDK